jgi:hypothetical protein
VRFSWQVLQAGLKPITSTLPTWAFPPTVRGSAQVALSVWYSIEYSFTGLTPWAQVKPNIGLVANPLNFQVDSAAVPENSKDPPRLVNKPCLLDSQAWRC